jgi:DNA polymerase III alpha subunit
MQYQNYHKHSHYTNARVPDSVTKYEEYAKRASELGHGIISSVEHGYQGRYVECYELAKKYNLHFLFGVEAYWVKNRIKEYEFDNGEEKVSVRRDSTNCHIILLAKNENGRQSINDILSEANITGYYYQPRIDIELIKSLPPNDVWVTSACIAGWKYGEEADQIFLDFHKHFGNNFFFEVQYHNTESQKQLNRHIINLSNKYNIPIIMGCDSHYISEDKAWERTDFIASKGITYADESGWYMDYPDEKTAYERFVQQGILTRAQIEEAISNTNVFLQVEEYNSPIFNYEVKMPILYKNLSIEERNQKFIDLIWNQWENLKQKIPQDKWRDYESEIQKEIDTVVVTKHSDYFLINDEIIKEGKRRGGVLTNSGRGSAVSMYINRLLDFTKVDRIAAKVKMYPERFMSPTRILESKSLADIDFNCANPDVFAEAQKDIVGEGHSYLMVANGTMKPKAAWKMYARSQNIDFELANEVSAQIEKYELALKHASEEEKDEIDPLDYIDSKYHDIYLKSKEYQGIVDSIKPSPCSYLLYDGDIRKEIGLILIKSQQTKKEFLCCVIDKLWAEDYKFLKNDLLKVKVVEVIQKVYDRIGIKSHDVNELIEICEGNQKVWDVYKNGWTLGINQVEQLGTKSRVAKYKPQNISELCAFVAAIRPGFKSMYKKFENRERFNYGIPSFDKLIQTDEMPDSYLLYQEMVMTALNFAGIPLSECYDIIKNIAKKRPEKVFKYKQIFLDGFANILIKEEKRTEEEAKELSQNVWQIIEDSAGYGFNSAHAYCVALDSLYGAYLKSHYPLYFYEVFLNVLEEKAEKDRMIAVQNEATAAYKIYFPPLRFRQDNRNVVAIPEQNAITTTLHSIKNFSKKISENLFALKDNFYPTFVDLLIDLEEKGMMSVRIRDLISIKYFEEFGGNKKLLQIYDEFTSGKNRYDKKHTDKTKAKRIEALKEYESSLPNESLALHAQVTCDREILGYIQATYDVSERYAYVMGIDLRFAPRIEIYCLASGKTASIKMRQRDYDENPFCAGDIIYCKHFTKKNTVKYVDGQYEKQEGDFTYWLDQYEIIKDFDNLVKEQMNGKVASI